MPTPQERVQAFIESWGDDPEYDELAISDDADSNYFPLSASDLRDVLNELEEHQNLLERVDTVLDANAIPEVIVKKIRRMLGNHTDRKEG